MPRSVVFTTCGTKAEAARISRNLVRSRLAACVNSFPVSSCYRWKGKIMNEREYLLIIKTRSGLFNKVKRRILALHSYETPEVVSLSIDRGYEKYLEWIDAETGMTRKARK